MPEIIADIDVSGQRRVADPAKVEKLAQGVALIRAMLERIEAEHGRLGLDILLSAYVSEARERIGLQKTIQALGNTRQRLIEILVEQAANAREGDHKTAAP